MTITVRPFGTGVTKTAWWNSTSGLVPSAPVAAVSFVSHPVGHWTANNPDALAQIRTGIQQAERGESVDLGSFAQYVDLEIDD